MGNVRFNSPYNGIPRQKAPKLSDRDMERLRRDCIQHFMQHNEELLQEQYIDMGRVFSICYLIALHRNCGWGQKRLARIVEQVADLMLWVNQVDWDRGEVRLEQLENELKNECKLVLKRDIDE